MRVRNTVILLLSATLAWSAHAATLGGATLPDSYPAEGQTLVLNGIGLRTVTILNVRAYVAGLYLAQKSHDTQAIVASPGPKVVLMQFLHSASKEQVETQFREGERNNCGNGECDPRDAPDFERLIAAVPAVKVGDTFTYVFTPGRVRALVNNRVVAEFANADLSRRLLEGFIGNHPPSADVKAGMLGLR